MSISCEICYAPYFIHFLFPRSLHDNQWGIVRFVCFSKTLSDNHVNVHDDISLHFISARGVCVCICAFVFLGRENCISIGNQLSTLFRKNKLRSWWKRRVYGCVCVTGLRPPSLHDLPIACETVSYSCILPLCVSPRCIYLPTHTRVCILSVSRFDDDNRKLIFRVYHHEVVEFIFLPAYVHNQCAILSLIYE